MKGWLSYSHLSAISAITPEGELYFNVYDHVIRTPEVVSFVKHLLRHVPDKLLIIWDGHPIHRSKVLRKFLSTEADDRVLLERLPGYAPELNPDEWVWRHLKHVELRNLCCETLEELAHELRKAVKRLRAKWHLIPQFFLGAGLL